MRGLLLVMSALMSIGQVACRTTASSPSFINTLPYKDGVIVYLICENQTLEGKSEIQRVCWEPTNKVTMTSKRTQLVLYCENRSGKDGEVEQVCHRVENVECEFGSRTGSNIAKLFCMNTEDKKLLEFRDQYRLRQIQQRLR